MRIFPGLLLLVLAWLQPLHFPPWTSWHSEILAFGAALAIGWHYVFANYRQRVTLAVEAPGMVIPFVLLGIIISAQLATGHIPYRGDAYTYLAYLALAIAGLLIGYNLEEKQSFKSLAKLLLFGAVCSGFIMLVQTFEVWDSSQWIHRSVHNRRSGGNLGQSNQLGTLLIMGLASVVYLYETRKLGDVAAVVLVSFLLFAIAATESRTALVSFAVIALWLLFKAKEVQFKTTTGVVLLLALYIGLLYILWPRLFAEVFQLEGGVPVNTSAFNRWIVWPQLVEAVLMSPWIGWGFGQVSAAHNAVVDAHAFSEPYTYAHNIILDFSIGLGLPLTILFVSIAVWWWIKRAFAVRSIDSWFCVALAAPVAVHSQLEFPFAYAYFLLPLMISLGMLEKQLNIKPVQKFRITSVTVCMAVATALTTWSSFEYLAIEEDFRVVRFEALRVGTTPPEYQRPQLHLFTQMDSMLAASRITPKPGMPPEEIERARVAALRFPWTAIQNRYALLLALNGNPDEARRQLQVIRALHGEKHFLQLRQAWLELSSDKFPQLKDKNYFE